MKIQKANLGKAGKIFWRKVLSEYDLTATHDLERLGMAAKCLDDLAEAERQVKTTGMFILNRYGVTTESPAIKTLRDTRLLFVKIIRELGCDLAAAQESRPPRQY